MNARQINKQQLERLRRLALDIMVLTYPPVDHDHYNVNAEEQKRLVDKTTKMLEAAVKLRRIPRR